MTRILVTAAGGTLAPVNIRLLQEGRRHPAWVLAVDLRADAVGRHFADAFATVPLGDDPSYVDAIAALVAQYRIDVVLPWSDEEALALAARREAVEAAGARLACADHRTLQIMSDKAASFRYLAQAGVRTPIWSVANTEAELRASLEERLSADGEAVVKPLVARGARGVYVIRSDVTGRVDYLGSREVHCDAPTFWGQHYAEVVRQIPVMVMERLYQPVYDIDILAESGRVIRAIPRERLNPAGIPFQGARFRSAPELLDLAEKVTSAFALSWLYDYDVMTARDGAPVIIEINPRPSGSMAATVRAGIALYDDLLDMAMGMTPPRSIDLPGDGDVVLPYMDCFAVPGVR